MTTNPQTVIDHVKSLRDAQRRLRSVLVANADRLSTPFTDDPSKNPWDTFLRPAVRAMQEAVNGACEALVAVAVPSPATRADKAEALRSDLYDDLDAFARQTQIPGLQHAQIRDHPAVFLTEGLLRRLADEAQPAKPDPCPHGCDISICPCLACEADETQQQPEPAVVPPPALTEAGRLRAQVQVLQQDAERDRGLAKVGARCMRDGHQGLIEGGRLVLEGWRFALSTALDLGTGAPWEAIHARVKELAAADVAGGARRAADDEQPETCGRTRSINNDECPPCARAVDHPEAYCRSADGNAYFLGIDAADEGQDAPRREPHPTEADMRHALAVFARFHGRDTAAAQPDGEA